MLSIAIRSFIIQSELKTCILIDSRPCVLAFEKLCQGEFSASLCQTWEYIVVPRQVLHSLLPYIFKLNHPSAYPFKLVCHRYLFALYLDKSIENDTVTLNDTFLEKDMWQNKAPVTLLKVLVLHLHQIPSQVNESSFFTSYTAACIVGDERNSTLCEALIRLSI